MATAFTYLHHRSAVGEFWLASDNMINTYLHWPRLWPVTSQISGDERRSF